MPKNKGARPHASVRTRVRRIANVTVMRRALVLLLTTFSAIAYAQPVYRCENSSGKVVFQDLACAEPSASFGEDQSQPTGQAQPDAAVDMASFNVDVREGDGGWTYQQRMARRRQAKLEERAEALRRRSMLTPSIDRGAADYAENSRRCRNAVQVASLCGSRARTFSCDDKGFRAESLTDVSAQSPSATSDNGGAFKMEQCALQAARGRS